MTVAEGNGEREKIVPLLVALFPLPKAMRTSRLDYSEAIMSFVKPKYCGSGKYCIISASPNYVSPFCTNNNGSLSLDGP